MKRVIAAIVIVILVFGVALPRFLAPDDIAGCSAPADAGRCQKADAVVAISGGDTLARAREAVTLYKAGWAPRLIFSGAAVDKSGPSNASVMRAEAESLGVPAGAITIDEDANTTSENAVNVVHMAHDAGYGRLIVVTSGYHQRRAGLEFAKAAAGDMTIINHPVQADNQWSRWWWATPIGWWLSASELVKIAAFYAGIA